jgi:hypothetical protein
MTVVKTRYEFGRHETFALREGWLDKGLARVMTHPEGFRPDLDTADDLGIGSRMAKSLAYWLDAAGLVARADGKRKTAPPASSFGEAVYARDPHFEYPVTAWFVHLMLARRPGSVWNWFFNDFRSQSFLREGCIEEFARAIREHSANQTTQGVIQREVGCLLNTYAALPASEPVDPEDFTVSPMRSLGLVLKHQDTGRFEKAHPLDAVPVEAFVAAVALMAADRGSASLPLTDLIALRNSPGRLFNLDGDMVSEAAEAAAEAYGKEGVRLSLHGATRTITVPEGPAESWYERHFGRIGSR